MRRTDEAADQSSESQSSESQTMGSESSDTGGALVCADFTDPTLCNAQGNDEITCSWTTLDLAARTGDSCSIMPFGYCLQVELVGDTNAGCGTLAGCEASSYLNPYFKIVPEGVLLLDGCGGTSEPGFSICSTGEASADDPPECACACALAP